MGFGVRFLWGAALFHCLLGAVFADDPISLVDLEQIAVEQNVALNLPVFPRTVDELRLVSKRLRKKVERAIERILQRPREAASFSNTVLAFDALMNELDEGTSLLNAMVSLDGVGPLAADIQRESLRLSRVAAEIYLNSDLYERLNLFSEMPGLDAESERLLEVILSCFSTRPKHLKQVVDGWEMEGLAVEVEKLSAKFNQNIYLRKPLRFTRGELQGLPQSVLEKLEKDRGGGFFVNTATWSEYDGVLSNVEVEETRRLVWIDANSGAPAENNELVNLILAGRARMAHRLGYASWSDHNLDSLSESPKGLLVQFSRLKALSAKAFARERKELAARLGRPAQPWDIAFVRERMLVEKGVDEVSLRPYFNFENVQDGLFRYCESIFSIRIRPITGAAFWPEARPFAIFNEADGALLGTFVVDPFARAGKEPWFMEIRMGNSQALNDGRRNLASALLHASYPAPGPDGLAPMGFDDVTTLFHEFGHVLHEIFPSQKHFFLGPDTANADLIEFPSILLERLAWEPEVIRTLARHSETGAPLDEERVMALAQSRKTLAAHQLRRRLADSIIDLKLNGARPRKAAAVEAEVYSKYFYALPKGTTLAGSSRYFIDYDALEWIYGLADAMADRQIELFRERSPDLTAKGIALGVRQKFFEAGSLYSSADLVNRTVGKSFRLCASLLNAAGLGSASP